MIFIHVIQYIHIIDKDKDIENIFQNNVVFFHHEYLIYIYINSQYLFVYKGQCNLSIEY